MACMIIGLLVLILGAVLLGNPKIIVRAAVLLLIVVLWSVGEYSCEMVERDNTENVQDPRTAHYGNP